MRKWMYRLVASAVLCSLMLGTASTTTVYADSYGANAYGSCAYGSSCTASASGNNSSAAAGAGTTSGTTTFQLADGLQIAVDLYNGEHIPTPGFLVTVTPLNGRGSSFSTAVFSIDRTTADTTKPDEEGTATWNWHPTEQPGTRVTVGITVTSSQGQTLSKVFQVIIGQALPVTSLARTSTDSNIPVGVIKVIQALPHIVVAVIPYFLFFLLAIPITISAWNAGEELREARTLREALRQLERVSTSRQSFIDLASHYLRTPVTLLSGGLELMPNETTTAPLTQAATDLHTQVDRLIDEQEAWPAPRVEQIAPSLKNVYVRASFWLPIVTCICLVIFFDYLANQAAVLSLQRITVYTQGIIGITLILASYLVLRVRQVGRRNAQLTSAQLTAAKTLLQEREQFLHEASVMLRGTLETLHRRIVVLADTPGKKYLSDGLRRLEYVMRSFTIADRLRGAHSQKPYETVRLHVLLTRIGSVTQRIAEKELHVEESLAAPLCQIQEPRLLQLVYTHILDNAIAYAPQGSSIAIASEVKKQGIRLTITDHGPGIPHEQQQALFAPFEKVEGSKTFTHEGMGFSLYLDMLIMAYLGGTIAITSHPGTTCVQLTLPQPPKRAAQSVEDDRGAVMPQMPQPSTARIAQAAPIVDSDTVNS